jgi:DnaJ domain
VADFREDYYRALGVPPDASPDEVRQAWLRLISYWHPDRTTREGAEERAKELNRAYQVLSDPDSRAEYDRWYGVHGSNGGGHGSNGGGATKTEDRPPWAASAARREKHEQRGKREPRAKPGWSNGSSPGRPATARVVTGWEPPPVDYRHHAGVDPMSGSARSTETGTRQAIGYVLWMAGFAAWLLLVAISTRITSVVPNPAVVTAVFVVDVMCLWIWLFAIAAVFRDRGKGQWWMFWAAELFGALTATSATLLVASIAIAAAVLTSPLGIEAFRQRGWVGAALAVLALSGALGAVTFRLVWQQKSVRDAPSRPRVARPVKQSRSDS